MPRRRRYPDRDVTAAGAVDLPCRYARKPDFRSLSAPDRTITIPDTNGGASERCAGGDDSGEGNEHVPNIQAPRNVK